MKKTYINPTMTIVKIQTAQMLAASEPGYGGTTTSTSGNLSRESSFWEEDEDY